ncbi:hypothetical protein BDY19DRAFT_996045 [Irpex rosettiformis]|uniref:Uncharacterized protein n=1 Tax=Irpex rosettiformis TaxID=378272 RepID=A0ACB8TW22_9APHY|nr:hypothetical protein BDY19DRAFT_996045 [Irpex rosettiformis]
MSSEDELGELFSIGPTRGAPRQAKAGPSKPTAAAAKKANKTAQEKSKGDASNTSDVLVLSSDDDGRKTVRKDTTVKGKGKEPAANTKAAPQPNGKAKAKGKAKTDSVTSPDAMEIDSGGHTEEVAPVTRSSRTARTNVKPVPDAPSPPPPKRPKTDSALEAEVARLQRSLDDLAAQRDRLSEQLKEALEVRETEPERLLAESMARYEESIQSQQHLLQEQTTSLQNFGVLSNSNASQNLQFITRDAAAEESKGLTERVKKLEGTIRDKNSRISEFEAKFRTLEKQLEAEVQMAKEYREKNHPGKLGANGPVKAVNGSSTPLDHSVIKLYEDLTNFLITKVVRGQAAYAAFPDLHEETFHCTFTHVGSTYSKGSNPSIQFTLRHMWLPVDSEATTLPTSKKDLVEKVEYIPNLENESEEFKSALDFFKGPFIFERDQLHVFMRTLAARVSEFAGDSSDEEE